jgi:hypothetical protein
MAMTQIRKFKLVRMGRAKRLTRGDFGPAVELGGGLQAKD